MNFLKALAVFLGTVIGVGIFGLPFVAMKAGFFVIIGYLVLMTFIGVTIHIMYAEVCLRETKKHRFPGYVNQYLGRSWSKFSFVVVVFGLMGALLSYLIIGGEFLNSCFSNFFGQGPFFYTILFFIAGAYLIFRDIKNISRIELLLLIVLLLTIAWFFIESFSYINIDNLLKIDLGFFFFPYGIVLFSLWGTSVIPELKEMMSIYPGKKMRLNLIKVVSGGIIFTAFLYLLFVYVVLGVSGYETSSEAVSGLGPILGNSIVKLGSVLGVLCCFTSFITIGLTLKKTFWYDLGISKNISWLLACFIPLILFFLGARDFIEVIGFTGSIFLGFEGIIIVFLYKEFLKKIANKRINPLFYILVGVFMLGIILEVIYFLS